MKLSRYMIGYPLVTVFCWTLPTIQRLGDLFSWDSSQFSDAAAVTVYIQGFLVFIIYCKTSPVLKLWKKCIYQMFIKLKIITPPPQTSQHHLPHQISFPSNMSLQPPPRIYTNETNSTEYPRPMVFSSSNNYDYDDDEMDEEYEGHRYQNTSHDRQRWFDSSFNIPPSSEELM